MPPRNEFGQRLPTLADPVKIADHFRKRGAQPNYDEATAQAILDRLAEGELLTGICRDIGFSPSTVRGWAREDAPAGFAARYARAVEQQMHCLVESTVAIAEDDSNDVLEGDKGPVVNGAAVQRAKLRIDNLHWIASKVMPKMYGDKVVLGGDPDNPVRLIGTTMTEAEAAEAYAETIKRRLVK